MWSSICLLAAVAALTALAAPLAAVAQDPTRPTATRPQLMPLQAERTFAMDNQKLDIDGLDDERVDVDIAVLDSGIDLENPDLNVVERTNCNHATWPLEGPSYECTNASPTDGMDDGVISWHGTGSAMAIAAIDNNIGDVGIAAGARLWAVDVHQNPYPDPNDPTRFAADLESVIAGVKWVTAHADEIEVAHIVLGCTPEQTTPEPPRRCWSGSPEADLGDEFEAAIAESIAAGVVYSVPAGNFDLDSNTTAPQRFDDMIVTSAMLDSDGRPGGLGPAACGSPDDTRWINSNWGTAIDVTAPGCATSSTSAYTTAAAAVLASRSNPNDADDVRAIGETIFGAGDCATTPLDVGTGACDWTDDSGDGVKEPLLDVGDEAIFDPVMTSGTHGSPGGWDYDLKTRCIKSLGSPQSVNYYEDTTQCGTGGGNWTAAVLAESTVSACPGPPGQSLEVNGAGSPVLVEWYSHWGSPLGPNWTVNLKLDNVYTSSPCLGPSSVTKLIVGDRVDVGGGPLPNPSALISSHQVSYGEWRPTGGSTRLVVAANFRWGGKDHLLEVNLNTGGGADLHPHPEVLATESSSTKERVVIDGPAIGLSVPSDYTTTTHSIDWKNLVQQATEEGWFSPMGGGRETISVYTSVETTGPALANLWTTNFRIAGK